MAKQLTQKTKDGNAYYRPADIEANIDGAIDQPLEILRQRLGVVQDTNPEYLTSECIVHLLRRAVEDGDESRQDVLHMSLMRRVDHNVRNKMRSYDQITADEVRLAVTAELTRLIVIGAGTLDFYEVKFNSALTNLRETKKRQVIKPPTLPLDDREEHDDRVVPMHESSALSVDLAAALRSLSAEQCKAFLLVEDVGYEIEATDPQKTTAATILGVSGRTVRNYLKAAKAKLAVLLKDHDS